MRAASLVLLASLVLAPQGAAQELATPTGKVDLRVLYAGHPGSDREADFLEFLESFFVKVGKADLEGFSAQTAEGWDVVLLDYDGDGFDAPRPSLGQDYSRATVTIGVMGALLGGSLRLKTGYL